MRALGPEPISGVGHRVARRPIILAGFLAAAFGVLGLRPAAAATLGWGDGVNLQPSYVRQGDVDLGWNLLVAQKKIRTVRIEIEPAVPIATVQRWLREAHAHGLTVIATYHHYPFNGSDSVAELQNAAKWWRANYAELVAAGPLVINLMNEWGSHQQTPASFAAAYNPAVALVREVYRGPVVVDLPGWGQEIHLATEAARLLADDNLVFSVHVYPSAWVEFGAHHWMTPADLDALADCGRPVLVGEFGGLRSGGADWSALVDRAKAKGWTVLGWAWNGDGEGMNMVLPEWEKQPDTKQFKPGPYFDTVYRKLREP